MTAEGEGVILNPQRPRLRKGVIAAAVADLGVVIWSISRLGYPGWGRNGFGLLFFSVAFAVLGAWRFAKEHYIVRHCGIAMGEIVDYTSGYDETIPIQRRYYPDRIRYRFQTSDGMFYHGVCSTGGVSQTGERMEIVYDRRNPAHNKPCVQMWVYTIPLMPVDEVQD